MPYIATKKGFYIKKIRPEKQDGLKICLFLDRFELQFVFAVVFNCEFNGYVAALADGTKPKRSVAADKREIVRADYLCGPVNRNLDGV